MRKSLVKPLYFFATLNYTSFTVGENDPDELTQKRRTTMSNNTINFAGTAYTIESLESLKGSELVALHNELAKIVDESPVKRFADKKSAIKRTWKLLEALPAPAQVKETQVSNETETTNAATPAAPKAKAEPKAKRVITYTRGEAPATKSYFINAVYGLVSEGVEREALVERVMEEVAPPRSQQYDRNFVLGYLAHMVQQGWLVKTVA